MPQDLGVTAKALDDPEEHDAVELLHELETKSFITERFFTRSTISPRTRMRAFFMGTRHQGRP